MISCPRKAFFVPRQQGVGMWAPAPILLLPAWRLQFTRVTGSFQFLRWNGPEGVNREVAASATVTSAARCFIVWPPTSYLSSTRPSVAEFRTAHRVGHRAKIFVVIGCGQLGLVFIARFWSVRVT